MQSSSLDDLDIEGEEDSATKASEELLLSRLVSLGYDLNLCKLCLKAFKNNIQKSIDFFFENKADLNDLTLLESKLNDLININVNKLSSEDIEKANNARKLINNLKSEISQDDEAYLDLNLEEDAFFINKYYSLINN